MILGDHRVQEFQPLKKRAGGPGAAKRRAVSRLAVLILALLPLLILIVHVAQYHVDVPFWDQWNFVPLLGKSYEQGITLGDLWGLHNEHRLLFPRLIMLGLAHISGYNIVLELVVIILLAVATFIVLWYQYSRTAGVLGYSGFPWVVPVFSLLVFTHSQAENWLWGWQIQIFLNVLAVVAGLVCLGSRPFRWKKYWAALGCGILATYSFANGLVFWPLGFLGLVLVSWRSKLQKKRALAGWLAATAGVTLSYLVQFHYKSPSGTPWTQFLDHPGGYLRYIFIYLGRPVIHLQEYALAVGLFGIIFFGLFFLYGFLKRREKFQAALPFFLCGLYSFGCALLTGIGRVGFGSGQATSGRYVPFSALLWISNFALLFFLSQEIRLRTGRRAGRILSLTGVGILAFFLVFWIGRTSFRVGTRVFKSYHFRLLPVRQELLRGKDDELLLRLYVDADYIREGIKVLSKHHLSVFRKTGL
jgi:hypothetical protein